MAVVRFHLISTLGPKDVLEVLTDFGPSRAEAWPTIDTGHFEVHELGDTWAEVTEGTAAAWERARYEWGPAVTRSPSPRSTPSSSAPAAAGSSG